MLGICSLHVSTYFMALVNDQKFISFGKLNSNESIILIDHIVISSLFVCNIAWTIIKLLHGLFHSQQALPTSFENKLDNEPILTYHFNTQTFIIDCIYFFDVMHTSMDKESCM